MRLGSLYLQIIRWFSFKVYQKLAGVVLPSLGSTAGAVVGCITAVNILPSDSIKAEPAISEEAVTEVVTATAVYIDVCRTDLSA